MKVRKSRVLFALLGGLALTSSAHGQAGMKQATVDGNSFEQAQREELAESIITREETLMGRRFDPAFRNRAKDALASLSKSDLEAQLSQVGLGTNALGDTAADLVYTPITPCRIIDTRTSAGGAGPIAAGATANFYVAGTTGFPSQGGKSGGCGVPLGATSAMINFVAVGAGAAGDVRVTPYGIAMPMASILNFAGGVSGLNLANGLAVKLCDPATTTCTYDITLQADVSAINIVADVQGYYKRAAPGILLTQLHGNYAGNGFPSGYVNVVTNYTPPMSARAFTFMRCSSYGTAAGQELSFRSAIRTPTGSGGTVTIGNTYYLDASTAAANQAVFNANYDFFDLTAGQSYDFGVSMWSAFAGGTSWCSAVVQIFSR